MAPHSSMKDSFKNTGSTRLIWDAPNSATSSTSSVSSTKTSLKLVVGPMLYASMLNDHLEMSPRLYSPLSFIAESFSFVNPLEPSECERCKKNVGNISFPYYGVLKTPSYIKHIHFGVTLHFEEVGYIPEQEILSDTPHIQNYGPNPIPKYGFRDELQPISFPTSTSRDMGDGKFNRTVRPTVGASLLSTQSLSPPSCSSTCLCSCFRRHTECKVRRLFHSSDYSAV